MKKTILILLTIIMIATTLICAAISVSAETTDVIPVPEVPAIDRPYKTIEELGIDFETIDSYFPRQIEIRYENGKVYVEDFGARSVEAFDYDSMANVSFELADGYWTAELASIPLVIHTYAYETSLNDKCLCASYYENGNRDSYVVLNDFANSRHISFAVDYGTVTVSYKKGNCYYEDRYEEGVFYTHGVSNREDPESINDVLFGVDGKIRYCILYINGYYYYFPGQGWSSNWEYFVACDAPEGYEDRDETDFAANKISLICTEAKGDDIVHDMSKAYCTVPSTCKNGCGYTIGEIEHHDWQLVDGEKECSLCDAVFFPDFEFIDRTYNTLEESGFPYDEIKAVFPEVLTVKYEDGKYMVKDVGADKAEVYTDIDYKDIELSLVDSWWICELDEEIYNDESVKIFVYFEGEIDDVYWDITYINGIAEGDLYLMSMSDDLDVLVCYDDCDRVVSMYYVGDRLYNDEYKNGALVLQEVSLFVGEGRVHIAYLADGSFERAYIYIDDEWYYYYPDGSWEKGVEALLTPPAGYENADVAYFESILPTTINCVHENYSAADCENPEYCLVCGIIKEGSAALGHDYDNGVITVPSTCMEVGERLFTCSHDSSHTYAIDEAIDENAHEWDEGTVIIPPTCMTEGEKTFICAHNGEHTKTEDVTIDESAHSWNEGVVTTNPTCTEKGVKTFTCTHNGAHTYTEDVTIDESAHSWNEGVVTTNPTCTEKGVKTFTCTHNGAHTYTEDVAIDANAHEYGSEWKTDANEHWNECACGDKVNKAAHVDNNADNKCDTCDYEMPAHNPDSPDNSNNSPDSQNNTPDDPSEDKDGLSGGAIAGIVAGSVAALGGGGFAIYWFVIKKKTWADLIAVFKKN